MNNYRRPYADAQPFTTKDGSEIRELMHPQHHGNQAQSLAEAIVQPGQRTQLHRHHVTEEIYHITAGQATMTLGEQHFAIGTGDTILIPPGTAHALHNPGPEALRLLCCCSPAYADADTEILDAIDG